MVKILPRLKVMFLGTYGLLRLFNNYDSLKANMDLYKVYVQTDDHPHILEMIVAGSSIEDAKEKALGHVKESNPTKGRHLEISQQNSKVLAAKKTGMHGALVINKIPVNVYKEIMENMQD